ncbi:UNVERIFIED_CONTAM: hypothetical protein Sradi_3302800 [Sesamum radiatum]|uniref:Uncharacterized protein n=1 Tax=Sesamum radiatum TaxID=300843 RepID=A0AAW2R2J6_SESRA
MAQSFAPDPSGLGTPAVVARALEQWRCWAVMVQQSYCGSHSQDRILGPSSDCQLLLVLGHGSLRHGGGSSVQLCCLWRSSNSLKNISYSLKSKGVCVWDSLREKTFLHYLANRQTERV